MARSAGDVRTAETLEQAETREQAAPEGNRLFSDDGLRGRVRDGREELPA